MFMQKFSRAIVFFLFPLCICGAVPAGLPNDNSLKEYLAESDFVVVASVQSQQRTGKGLGEKPYLLRLIVQDILYEKQTAALSKLRPRRSSSLEFIFTNADNVSLYAKNKVIVFLKLEFDSLSGKPYFRISDPEFGIQRYTHTAASLIRRIYRGKKIIYLSGLIKKGQKFERQVGEDLFFRLIPQQLGWGIFLGTQANSADNFARVVTPPYRGINVLDIEGWHFRNSDNTGSNRAGLKNINAPQETREFYFVLSPAAYQEASAFLRKILWPASYSLKEIEQAKTAHWSLEKGRGVFTIRKHAVNKPGFEKQACIEFLKFDLKLEFPESQR